MDKKKFYKRVLVLAVPIALQNLLTALLNIFDQMMVGWLPGELPGTGLSVADTGLSAVLLANQIVFIYQIVIFAVCNTVNIFIGILDGVDFGVKYDPWIQVPVFFPREV